MTTSYGRRAVFLFDFIPVCNLIPSFIVSILILLSSLPCSSVGVNLPCGNRVKYDTIVCSPKDRLILTLAENYFEGDCSDYPFFVNPEPHSILHKQSDIIASLVDHKEIIYFFEKKSVIIYDNGIRPKTMSIHKMFEHFPENASVDQAIFFPSPQIKEGISYKNLITLYSGKDIYYFARPEEKNSAIGNNVIWKRVEPWNSEFTFPSLNKTTRTIKRVVGLSNNIVKTILQSEDEDEIYYTASFNLCSDIVYKLNLFECLEENFFLQKSLIHGPLVRCVSNQFAGFDLLSFMLYGSSLLVILAFLGIIKCGTVWVYKKLRRTRRKAVRFSEGGHHGDPKKSHIILTYGIDHPSRIQTYSFDSVGQSAVSINDDYKDINYSSDVAEDDIITIKESESKSPLDSIQNPRQ